MADFILEIYSEEIPALMQNLAAQNFAKIAKEIFTKNNFLVEDSNLKSLVSPNRLTLEIHNLSAVQKIPSITKIGPKISADKRAIEGFLKSFLLEDLSQLSQVENNGSLCYCYTKPESEIKTGDILKKLLPQVLQKMVNTWPKLMRWNVEGFDLQPQWIRPIRNIACVLGSEIVEFEFANLKSNNLTFGHFLHSSKPIKIEHSRDYQDLLKDNFVLVDQEKRKRKILTEVRKIKIDIDLESIDDEEKSSLFDELTGLCEWPTALLAVIDKKFMSLPDEVLILTLKLNQKYICLKNNAGHLAPDFIFISNAIINKSNETKIIQDNEKLVKARLADAEFFIHEDLKTPLAQRVFQLKKIIFHQKLGSLYDKITRINGLAKSLSVFVPHCNLPLVEKAVNLSKTDLTCKMVAELPELQGKIGSYYASRQGQDKKVVAAIYEHYLPLGPNSELPKTSLGIVISIADKIDSIVGFFLADEKPTSSKDPYALRRAALGIIRIGFEYNIAFPIRVLIEKSFNAYPAKLVKSLLGQKEGNFYENKKNLVEEIVKFFVERLKVYLKDNELVRADIVNAVIEEYLSDLDAHKYCNILYLAKKIKFLANFTQDAKHKNIIALYKRSNNILTIEEKKDGKKYAGKPALLSLKTSHEKILYRRIKQISPNFKKLIAKGEFDVAFRLLDVLEIPLTHFFDNVLINDKNKNIRENRLLLLSKIRSLFGLVADLSMVEIEA